MRDAYIDDRIFLEKVVFVYPERREILMVNPKKVVSRKEFLHSIGLGTLAIFFFSRFTLPTQAASNSVLFADNMGGSSGAFQGAKPPSSTKQMWLNTGDASNTFGAGGVAVPHGALCYNDGEGWKPTTTTWS